MFNVFGRMAHLQQDRLAMRKQFLCGALKTHIPQA